MKTDQNGLPWYACEGDSLDVVVSSRARLARNLANFPFPSRFRGDDGERVQTLVFDSFSQLQMNDSDFNFHAVDTKTLDGHGRKILEERGVLKRIIRRGEKTILPESGVVMSMDGRCSTAINCGDHLRISYFQSGLALRNCFDECCRVDSGLQKTLQFAASYDFGFLTASLLDAGSGLKLSARIHIPASVYSGKLNQITEIARNSRLKLNPAFPELSRGSVAGSFFLLETSSAMNGTELDQIAEFESACRCIVETERKNLEEYADNKKTIIRNSVLRAYSIAKLSLLISLNEAVDIISDLMTGLKIGMVSGIQMSQLCGLLYRIMPGHLEYLLESSSFTFEKDIENDIRTKTDRIRALILQEAFEKITMGNV